MVAIAIGTIVTIEVIINEVSGFSKIAKTVFSLRTGSPIQAAFFTEVKSTSPRIPAKT